MIKTRVMDPSDFQSSIFGMTAAFRDVLRVLVMMHPESEALVQAMYKEREETIAKLLADGFSDLAIEAYRDTIDSIRPHFEGDDMNPP